MAAIFGMKFLDSSYLAKLFQLQELIRANLPCKEIFILHDEEYFSQVLSRERSALGVFSGEQLIAFSIIRIPGHSSENLGRDINLHEKELGGVAHLQAAAVHPANRGHGLQRKLIRAHLAVIEEMGYDHACCTVSPKNPVSIGNYLSCGLVIEGLCPKKHGWWRFILHKNMKNAGEMNESCACAQTTVGRISITDIEGQLDLIRRGFKGFRISNEPEGAKIYYGKF